MTFENSFPERQTPNPERQRKTALLAKNAWSRMLALTRVYLERIACERPHEALGMCCPAEMYRDSTRRYSGAEVQLSYPGMATRSVDKNGKLSWKQQKVFVTGSLAGWEVGLQRSEKGQLEVWFDRLLLGHLDPLDVTFLRADIKFADSRIKEL
jgi:hypothetical protein